MARGTATTAKRRRCPSAATRRSGSRTRLLRDEARVEIGRGGDPARRKPEERIAAYIRAGDPFDAAAFEFIAKRQGRTDFAQCQAPRCHHRPGRALRTDAGDRHLCGLSGNPLRAPIISPSSGGRGRSAVVAIEARLGNWLPGQPSSVCALDNDSLDDAGDQTPVADEGRTPCQDARRWLGWSPAIMRELGTAGPVLPCYQSGFTTSVAGRKPSDNLW